MLKSLRNDTRIITHRTNSFVRRILKDILDSTNTLLRLTTLSDLLFNLFLRFRILECRTYFSYSKVIYSVRLTTCGSFYVIRVFEEKMQICINYYAHNFITILKINFLIYALANMETYSKILYSMRLTTCGSFYVLCVYEEKIKIYVDYYAHKFIMIVKINFLIYAMANMETLLLCITGFCRVFNGKLFSSLYYHIIITITVLNKILKSHISQCSFLCDAVVCVCRFLWFICYCLLSNNYYKNISDVAIAYHIYNLRYVWESKIYTCVYYTVHIMYVCMRLDRDILCMSRWLIYHKGTLIYKKEYVIILINRSYCYIIILIIHKTFLDYTVVISGYRL